MKENNLKVISSDDFFDQLDNQSSIEKAYWCVYRFISNFRPRYIWRGIKSFFQRGVRGWADSDTWSMDSYLARIIPEMLTYLIHNRHGVPMMEDDWISMDVKESGKLYDAKMQEIIDGFMLYDSDMRLGTELLGAGLESDTPEQKNNRKKWEKSKELFVKYFESFWD